MKTRSSLNKASWSETREESYHEWCDQILFGRKWKIVIDDKDVYLKSTNDKRLLLTITKPKAMWYEIWMQLRQL